MKGVGWYQAMPSMTFPQGPPSGTEPRICVAFDLQTWVPGPALPFLIRLVGQGVRSKERHRN